MASQKLIEKAKKEAPECPNKDCGKKMKLVYVRPKMQTKYICKNCESFILITYNVLAAKQRKTKPKR